MKRNIRRFWVVLYYLVLFVLFPLVPGWGWESLAFLVLLFASPAIVTGTELLEALNDPDANADERQRSLINETMTRAYAVLAALLVVPSFLLGFTDDLPAAVGAAVEGYITGHLFDFMVLALLVATLPAAVLMWLEPDPLPDETDAELSVGVS